VLGELEAASMVADEHWCDAGIAEGNAVLCSNKEPRRTEMNCNWTATHKTRSTNRYTTQHLPFAWQMQH
jgi:hypothetical protein